MSQDGVGATHSEERAAVRSVIREALEREADWSELASAGLLALAVPRAHGGEGLGLGEVAELLRETGARAAHLPVWETLCCGGLTLAAAGSDEQQARLLPGVADRRRPAHPGIAGDRCRHPGGADRHHRHGLVTGRKVGVTFADASPRCWCLSTTATGSSSPWSTPLPTASPCVPSPSSSGRTQHTVVLAGAPARCCPATAPPGSCASSRSPASA